MPSNENTRDSSAASGKTLKTKAAMLAGEAMQVKVVMLAEEVILMCNLCPCVCVKKKMSEASSFC